MWAPAKEWFARLPRSLQVALALLVAGEAVLIVAAERDIQRRPAEEIRGRKLIWRVIALNNFIGPTIYFRWGRRRAS
ncbi:MAG: hypothetical protein ACYCXW_13250 [Solirubrobacteraceae bacterium]